MRWPAEPTVGISGEPSAGSPRASASRKMGAFALAAGEAGVALPSGIMGRIQHLVAAAIAADAEAAAASAESITE